MLDTASQMRPDTRKVPRGLDVTPDAKRWLPNPYTVSSPRYVKAKSSTARCESLQHSNF